MGYMVFMDENGDAEGNYTLVSLDTVNGTTGTFYYIYTYTVWTLGTRTR